MFLIGHSSMTLQTILWANIRVRIFYYFSLIWMKILSNLKKYNYRNLTFCPVSLKSVQTFRETSGGGITWNILLQRLFNYYICLKKRINEKFGQKLQLFILSFHFRTRYYTTYFLIRNWKHQNMYLTWILWIWEHLQTPFLEHIKPQS